MDFAGRTVVVTGAASGIGRASAIRFADAGARVIALDIAEAALAMLAGEAAGRIETLAYDLCAPDLPTRLMEAAGGRVDVLANVAGVMDGFLAAGEVDDETWERALAVNLTAPMRLMRAVLPGMIESGSGAIVNVASEAAVRGGCAGAAYTASKHGLVGLTKNTAFLYAKTGVRVNAVAPGPVNTGMQPAFASAVAGERLPAVIQACIGRIAMPDEIADTILWLASDAARNVTGAVIMSDGGWSAA